MSFAINIFYPSYFFEYVLKYVLESYIIHRTRPFLLIGTMHVHSLDENDNLLSLNDLKWNTLIFAFLLGWRNWGLWFFWCITLFKSICILSTICFSKHMCTLLCNNLWQSSSFTFRKLRKSPIIKMYMPIKVDFLNVTFLY